jgi:hypothetical protein
MIIGTFEYVRRRMFALGCCVLLVIYWLGLEHRNGSTGKNAGAPTGKMAEPSPCAMI